MTLRGHGYATTLVGIQHVTTEHPSVLGYDAVHQPADMTCDEIAHTAVETIRAHAGGHASRPLFLDVGFFETHRPFPAGAPGADRYLRPPDPLPDAPATRQDMAAYHESLRLLDRGLGRVLDALDETGLGSNTIVVCTTDHGVAFPFMKGNLTDHGTGVLLILRQPGRVPAGVVTDALVSQVDLYPTLCDLIGIPPPAWLQGRSLLALLENPAAEVNEQVFSEVTYHAAYEPQRSVRTHRWTYIRRFADRATPVLPNCDDSPSRDLVLAHGWDRAAVDAEMLFDNVLDPMHRRNLAHDPVCGDARAELRDRLHAWMVTTRDPLLDGPVPLPPGALMNNVGARSATDEVIIADADGSLRVAPNPGIHR
jgi:arylsulfatase A-like enzyme